MNQGVGAAIEPVSTGPLAALENARALLEHARTVDEVKDIRDKAEALRLYTKQANLGLDIQNQCAEVKLRAERKVGELIATDERYGRGKKSVTVTDLGLTWSQSSRWQRIADLPDDEFETFIKQTVTGGRELTTSGALKLAKRVQAAAKPPPRTVDWSGGSGNLPAAFTTVVADPPWQYDNVATRGAATDHYGTMSMDELIDLDINNLPNINDVGASAPIADNAHLYLWVTNGFLREGFDIIDAWGFTYKACLTWIKPQIGMGNYFRNSTEHVLFGIKGRLPTNRDDVPTWFQADRTRHSAKPDCFYDLVESSSPGPYLEMFSRRRRLNAEWHYWGNEA